MRILVTASLMIFSTAAMPNGGKCFNQGQFPAFKSIEEAKGSLEATHINGAVYRQKRDGWHQVKDPTSSGGQVDGVVWPIEGTDSCADAIPEFELDPKVLAEEGVKSSDLDNPGKPEIKACTKSGDTYYFALKFCKEKHCGWSAPGGIGRYNETTDTLEIRSPSEVRDADVEWLFHDRGETILATEGRGIHCRRYVAAGIVSYDWEHQLLRSRAAEFCGHTVNDARRIGDQIWFATDLGVSRLEVSDGENVAQFQSKNYSILSDQENELKAVQCRTLWTDMLKNLPAEPRKHRGMSHGPLSNFYRAMTSVRQYELRDLIIDILSTTEFEEIDTKIKKE